MLYVSYVLESAQDWFLYVSSFTASALEAYFVKLQIKKSECLLTPL